MTALPEGGCPQYLEHMAAVLLGQMAALQDYPVGPDPAQQVPK